MKRTIALLLILVCISGIAAADTDLSSMTFDELVALNKAVVMEIMTRPEWKEVTVPGGTWIVGKDIPAGTYSITPAKGGGFITVKDASGKNIVNQGIRNAENAIGRVELLDGYTVYIERGSVIFSPAIGLGF